MISEPALLFSQSLTAWGTADFKATIKRELEQLGVTQLPLQQGLTTGSHALDDNVEAMILNVSETDSSIHVKAGILYKSVIAGCSCADDPTPIDECNEYCEIQLDIDKLTAETAITLLAA